MKYIVADRFRADLARLSPAHRALFAKVIREAFLPALERRRTDRSAAWPAGLRVRAIAQAPGIWEMTWSFAGPDGRATFEWVTVDGEPAIRWRRIGSHDVFEEP